MLVIRRLSVKLAFLWSFYFFAAFTFGRNPDYTQPIIWGGISLLMIITLKLYLNKNPKIPAEAIILFALMAWSLTGFIVLDDLDLYLKNLRFLVQYLIVMIVFSFAIKTSGNVTWFCWALIGTSIYNVIFGILLPSEYSPNYALEVERTAGLFDNANGLGMITAYGVFGALALIGNPKRCGSIKRGFLISAIAISMIGVLASASRTGLLAATFFIAAWSLLCLDSKANSKVVIVTTALMGLIFYISSSWIIDETIMGQRLLALQGADDRSSHIERFELILNGIELATTYPFGIGLGQFVFHSRLGYVGHSDFAELVGATGFVGIFIYYLMYYVLWRRITKVLRFCNLSYVIYWCNIARTILLTIFVVGITSRPNYTFMDVWLLFGYVLGVGLWAESMIGVNGKIKKNNEHLSEDQ